MRTLYKILYQSALCSLGLQWAWLAVHCFCWLSTSFCVSPCEGTSGAGASSCYLEMHFSSATSFSGFCRSIFKSSSRNARLLFISPLRRYFPCYLLPCFSSLPTWLSKNQTQHWPGRTAPESLCLFHINHPQVPKLNTLLPGQEQTTRAHSGVQILDMCRRNISRQHRICMNTNNSSK